MPTPQYHDTHEIVIAATLWLMHRYRQTRCSKLARLVEQHLRWMRMGATSPVLANACRRLSVEWRAMSCRPSRTNTANPQPARH